MFEQYQEVELKIKKSFRDMVIVKLEWKKV
jgi:hypothetical protein